jgi:hypothetical protein
LIIIIIFQEKEEIERLEGENISPAQKNVLIKARVGQGKYREKLLKECPCCPITLVSDERL